MLDQMIIYFKKSLGKSLIARIYGVFTLKTNIFSSVHILIMQNLTYGSAQNLKQRLIFDLKGSQLGRKIKLKPDQLVKYESSKEIDGVLKDLNFIELSKRNKKGLFYLEKIQAKAIWSQLEDDSFFLRQFGLMDYSLLFSLHSVSSVSQS